MSEEIYRKKSLEKVKSPESLEDYIRISNPSVWLLLISIIVLLAGACVWGAVGRIDSTIPVDVQAENGKLTTEVDEAAISDMHEGMIVKIDDVEATVSDVVRKDNRFVCTLQAEKSIPDGFYEGKLVVERIQPLSFVFN